MRCLSLVLLLAASTARADVIWDWNETTLDTIRRTSTSPPVAARALAMTHVAMHDAINSVDRAHQHFRVYAAATTQASPEAAAAQAAHGVLASLFPDERDTLDRALTNSLAGIANDPQREAGLQIGRIVAGRIIAWRADDGSRGSVTHESGTAPGEWRPTPPSFSPPLLPQWARLRPFAIPRPSSFRPPFPPALDSAEYARDWQEVLQIGAADSTERTAEQTEIAHFWADGAGTVTPPGHWNRIAREVARREGLSLTENARLFALLNVALADAAIACWDMKFACNLWRPVTAIREADTDGNDLTERDPDWLPLLDTPPFPTCTSGHSTFSGAAAEMLRLFFGRDDISFSDADEYGIRREFASFWQAAHEAGRSRIYGGIHFEFDNHAGLESGRNISRYVFERFLRPLEAGGNQVARQEALRPVPSATARTADEAHAWRPATITHYRSDIPVSSSVPLPVTTYYLPATTSYYSPTTTSYYLTTDATAAYSPTVTYRLPSDGRTVVGAENGIAPEVCQPLSIVQPTTVLYPAADVYRPTTVYYLDTGW
jgi:hypothetical protein